MGARGRRSVGIVGVARNISKLVSVHSLTLSPPRARAPLLRRPGAAAAMRLGFSRGPAARAPRSALVPRRAPKPIGVKIDFDLVRSARRPWGYAVDECRRLVWLTRRTPFAVTRAAPGRDLRQVLDGPGCRRGHRGEGRAIRVWSDDSIHASGADLAPLRGFVRDCGTRRH